MLLMMDDEVDASTTISLLDGDAKASQRKKKDVKSEKQEVEVYAG